MKLLFHAFQLLCLTLLPSLAKPELFLANVEQRKAGGQVSSGGSKSGSPGQDYSMPLEQEREMGDPENSDDGIFHPSEQTIDND